jgi:SAM-dependent methyltransferase
VLEVGAGEGALAWRLAERFEYVGLEPDSESFAVATRRLAVLGRGRVIQSTTAEFLADAARDPFDLVCAFEVLEHLTDTAGELARWRRLLREGGYALVSVPAHRRRFAAADRAVGHVRRYDRGDLEEMLVSAGFELLWIEAWGAGLGYALEWVRNRVARPARTTSAAAGTARSGRWLQPRAGLGKLVALGAAPFRLLQHPFRNGNLGIGWVALARRAA